MQKTHLCAFFLFNQEIDFDMYLWLESIVWPLVKATGVTLSLAVAALICGLALALIFALLESAPIKWLAKLATGLVMLIRGLPEVLVVIAIYNGIPLLLGVLADGFNLNLGFHQFWIQVEIEDFDVNPILCGIIALSLLYACYASQTLRGAFKAISSGQQRAAEALGLSKARTIWRIILPQMWHHALPGLGNQWLVLLKDTALVSLIAVNDIMLQTRTIISNQQHPFMWYLIAAMIYLIISLFSQAVLQRIERKTRYYEQQGVNHG